MRSIRQTLCIVAAVLVLLSQPFAFQSPSTSQSQSPPVTGSSNKPNRTKLNRTAQAMVLTSIAKGRRFRVPRIAQRHLRVLPHNAETVPTASARAAVERVPIMVG